MLGIALAVVAVLAAVAGLLAFVTPGYLVTRVFDDVAVALGVQRVLVEDYRLTVSEVTCPAGVHVVVGAPFACAAVVNGRSVAVPLRVLSRSGDYEVGRPG